MRITGCPQVLSDEAYEGRWARIIGQDRLTGKFRPGFKSLVVTSGIRRVPLHRLPTGSFQFSLLWDGPPR